MIGSFVNRQGSQVFITIFGYKDGNEMQIGEAKISYDPVRGFSDDVPSLLSKQLDFTIVASSIFEHKDLFTNSYRVKVQIGPADVFEGWTIPFEQKEPVLAPPYLVTVSAIDYTAEFDDNATYSAPFSIFLDGIALNDASLYGGVGAVEVVEYNNPFPLSGLTSNTRFFNGRLYKDIADDLNSMLLSTILFQGDQTPTVWVHNYGAYALDPTQRKQAYNAVTLRFEPPASQVTITQKNRNVTIQLVWDGEFFVTVPPNTGLGDSISGISLDWASGLEGSGYIVQAPNFTFNYSVFDTLRIIIDGVEYDFRGAFQYVRDNYPSTTWLDAQQFDFDWDIYLYYITEENSYSYDWANDRWETAGNFPLSSDFGGPISINTITDTVEPLPFGSNTSAGFFQVNIATGDHTGDVYAWDLLTDTRTVIGTFEVDLTFSPSMEANNESELAPDRLLTDLFTLQLSSMKYARPRTLELGLYQDGFPRSFEVPNHVEGFGNSNLQDEQIQYLRSLLTTLLAQNIVYLDGDFEWDVSRTANPYIPFVYDYGDGDKLVNVVGGEVDLEQMIFQGRYIVRK